MLLGLDLDPDNQLAFGNLRCFRKRVWIACIGYLRLVPSQLLLTIRQDIDLRRPLLKDQKQLAHRPGSPQLPQEFNGPFRMAFRRH